MMGVANAFTTVSPGFPGEAVVNLTIPYYTSPDYNMLLETALKTGAANKLSILSGTIQTVHDSWNVGSNSTIHQTMNS